MADIVQKKSRGLKFAEQQLLRHGWEQGKGLGRDENGISEAIKVKVKCNKGGFGHKEGDQFTFHWWDHVFNKASSSLQVESDQNGVQLKKSAEDDEENSMISNKKPRKATLAKDKLYGCFVKSATLLSGQEQPEPKSASSDESSSSEDDDDQKLDLSTTFKLSDADLMKACGGRTAHKGARHGLTMSAKLARLEQQEAEFMAKYGKKSPAETSQSAMEDGSLRAKSKSAGDAGELNDTVPENPEMDNKIKKKQKKKRRDKDSEEVALEAEEEVTCVENINKDPSNKTKRKKKNDTKTEEESPSSPAESLVETTEFVNKRKKKKKKKSKSPELQCDVAAEETEDTESKQAEPTQDCPLEAKSRKAVVLIEAAEGGEQGVTGKQKRKKCKKDKARDGVDEEDPRPKKKKKKKSKE